MFRRHTFRSVSIAALVVLFIGGLLLTQVSPASAHHPIIGANSACVDGHQIVTVTISNSESQSARIMTIVSTNPDMGLNGTTVPASGSVTHTFTYSGSDTGSKTYSVVASWFYSPSAPKNVPGSVTLKLKGDCTQKNEAQVSHINCAEMLVVYDKAPTGLTGTTATATIHRPDGTDITVTSGGGYYNGPTAKWSFPSSSWFNGDGQYTVTAVTLPSGSVHNLPFSGNVSNCGGTATATSTATGTATATATATATEDETETATATGTATATATAPATETGTATATATAPATETEPATSTATAPATETEVTKTATPPATKPATTTVTPPATKPTEPWKPGADVCEIHNMDRFNGQVWTAIFRPDGWEYLREVTKHVAEGKIAFIFAPQGAILGQYDVYVSGQYVFRVVISRNTNGTLNCGWQPPSDPGKTPIPVPAGGGDELPPDPVNYGQYVLLVLVAGLGLSSVLGFSLLRVRRH